MKKRIVGRTGARQVEEVVLESADAAVTVLNWGCSVRDWRVDALGRVVPVVLGFPRFEDYPEHARSHGAVVGRVANRTASSRFTLEGRSYHLTPNEGAHHLHGGPAGLGHQVWDMERDEAGEAVHLRYHSPDGEMGYPGAVDFAVTYRLEGPRLVCDLSGRPDRPTPINLAQHNYYNLGGGGDVRDHALWIAARSFTPVDAEGIPLGTIEPVEGTHLDFTALRSFEESDPGRLGIDVNYVLDPERDRKEPSARAACPRTGLHLRLWTDEPGLQVFNAPKQRIGALGHGRQSYGHFSGLCLEPQHFPDSLHNPDWPSIIRSPEAPYFQRLVVEISR